jgi:hypothetical protein
MTSATIPAAAAPLPSTPSLGRRLGNVVRLHLANPTTILVVPLSVLAVVFVVMMAIAGMILINAGDTTTVEKVSTGFQYSGAGFYIFVYMMVVAIQAMNATFNYALGLGVTRRDYYLGSAVTFVLLSLAFTVFYSIMGAIEEATTGWGLGVRMFTSVYYGDSVATRFVVVLCAFLFFFFAGTVFAAVFVRWKGMGLTLLFLVLALLGVGAAFLVTITRSWDAFWGWINTTGYLGLALWSLALTVIMGVAGWALLRRATPRG